MQFSRHFMPARSSYYLAVVLGAVLASACTCSEKTDETAPAGSASARAPGQLSPELAGKVLAKVGDRTITLGDYATALERMDTFERMRYQTADRRKRLLDEMIDVELLAIEAKRRGLDEKPQAKELVRQVLRDALLKETRDRLPPLQDIPMSEVRAYYEAHRSDFKEPERRRLSVIVTAAEAQASAALNAVKGGGAEAWGKAVERYSIERRGPQSGPEPPPELAGDVGLVTPPEHGRSDNPRVPEPVRAAAFRIEKVGDVLDEVVTVGGRHYVVRLMGQSDARDRSLEEAERTIRVKILREMMRKAEEELERELREKFPVKVHDAALQQVKVPSAEPVKP